MVISIALKSKEAIWIQYFAHIRNTSTSGVIEGSRYR